jgi:hypothetical protein
LQEPELLWLPDPELHWLQEPELLWLPDPELHWLQEPELLWLPEPELHWLQEPEITGTGTGIFLWLSVIIYQPEFSQHKCYVLKK